MERMIYICEYDGTTERGRLLELAGHLPVGAEKSGQEAAGGGIGEAADVGVRAGEAARAAALRWKKRRERILAWLLLEYALKRESGFSLEQLAIVRTEKGKPRSSTHPEIWFNLSHCENACACIVGREPCGIDIERKFPFRESLARKICHEKEWDFFRGTGQSADTPVGSVTGPSEDGRAAGVSEEQRRKVRERQLQILWSLKESFVKRDGRGLGYGMDRVSFARLMPFPDTGICPERSVLWDCKESYTLAACAGGQELAMIDPGPGAKRLICSLSEQEIILQTEAEQEMRQ